jgi:hypothetical protein
VLSADLPVKESAAAAESSVGKTSPSGTPWGPLPLWLCCYEATPRHMRAP